MSIHARIVDAMREVEKDLAVSIAKQMKKMTKVEIEVFWHHLAEIECTPYVQSLVAEQLK